MKTKLRKILEGINQVTLLRDMHVKKTNTFFKKGDKGSIEFPPPLAGQTYIVRFTRKSDGASVAFMAVNANKTATGFTKEPNVKTMEKWMDNGIAQTITGKRTEPDGSGPDGSPSWLLVLGLI